MHPKSIKDYFLKIRSTFFFPSKAVTNLKHDKYEKGNKGLWWCASKSAVLITLAPGWFPDSLNLCRFCTGCQCQWEQCGDDVAWLNKPWRVMRFSLVEVCCHVCIYMGRSPSDAITRVCDARELYCSVPCSVVLYGCRLVAAINQISYQIHRAHCPTAVQFSHLTNYITFMHPTTWSPQSLA
jgi:hypothetical protein